jgi:broad specificity phosphatase PhoE
MNITELRQQIHRDLRIQHPEWIQPNGESPMCDSYEARFMQVLEALMRRGSNADVAASDHAIG